MRMRRKKWARPELEVCDFFLQDPTSQKDNWNKVFKNKAPIYLELGCGKGAFISEFASQNKQFNFIGIDLISDMLGLAKRNVEKVYSEKNLGIDNIKLLSYDIERIDDVIGNQDEIESIFINFCNPWPKPRHQKRRLTHTKQLEKYKMFLKKGGDIYLKTDDDAFFEDSLKYFEDSGFKIIYKTYDLHKECIGSNVVTEHEEMFAKQGIKIKAAIAQLI